MREVISSLPTSPFWSQSLQSSGLGDAGRRVHLCRQPVGGDQCPILLCFSVVSSTGMVLLIKTTCVHVCAFVYVMYVLCICMCVCICVYVMCVYMCVFPNVYVCVCVCICVFLSGIVQLHPSPSSNSQVVPPLSWLCKHNLTRTSVLLPVELHESPMSLWKPLQGSEWWEAFLTHFSLSPKKLCPSSFSSCLSRLLSWGYQTQKSPDEKQRQSQIQEHPFPPPGDIGHALPQARSAHSPLCRRWLQVAPKQASTQGAGGRSSFLTNTLRFEWFPWT